MSGGGYLCACICVCVLRKDAPAEVCVTNIICECSERMRQQKFISKLLREYAQKECASISLYQDYYVCMLRKDAPAVYIRTITRVYSGRVRQQFISKLLHVCTQKGRASSLYQNYYVCVLRKGAPAVYVFAHA